MTQNQLAYWNLRETVRSNQAREYETHRSNVAKEQETNRSNLAREAETKRSNVAQESLGWFNAQELQQHHRNTEQINQMNAFSQREQAEAATSQAQSAEVRAQNDSDRVRNETVNTVFNAIDKSVGVADTVMKWVTYFTPDALGARAAQTAKDLAQAGWYARRT